jgi:organic hydroperoxide reductase OsmC/OhrA
MLFFLGFAAKSKFVVERYEDTPLGVMTRNQDGRLFISRVTLNPAIAFAGTNRPSAADVDALHHRSHEECFIANSVKTDIVVAASKLSFE